MVDIDLDTETAVAVQQVIGAEQAIAAEAATEMESVLSQALGHEAHAELDSYLSTNDSEGLQTENGSSFLMGLMQDERTMVAAVAAGAVASAVIDLMTESPEERAQAEQLKREEAQEALEELAKARSTVAAASPRLAGTMDDVIDDLRAELGDGASSVHDSELRAILNRLKNLERDLNSA